MKFLILVKATKASEAGVLPDEQPLSDMIKFNEEMVRAGILLDAAGLQPSSKAARVRFHADGKRTVIDGPFTEAKELVAGYWLIQVKSREEAIEWIKRCPNPYIHEQGDVEIRQLFEMDDFPAANAETVARAAEIDKQLTRT